MRPSTFCAARRTRTSAARSLAVISAASSTLYRSFFAAIRTTCSRSGRYTAPALRSADANRSARRATRASIAPRSAFPGCSPSRASSATTSSSFRAVRRRSRIDACPNNCFRASSRILATAIATRPSAAACSRRESCSSSIRSRSTSSSRTVPRRDVVFLRRRMSLRTVRPSIHRIGRISRSRRVATRARCSART